MSFLQPAPHLPEIQDPAQVKSIYTYWRFRILYSMFIGYALYYFTRKSFVFCMPGIMQELGYEKSDLGIMGSVFAISYGMSKFVSGIFSDQSNPRYFMALGLIITGILNLCMGFSSALLPFAFFWGLNGLFQGFGSPPCVRLLTHWYSHSERGSWWSTWTSSQNAGAFLIPWIVGICLQWFGWRYGLFVPGLFCILGGFFLINRLADTPQSLGLPPVERWRNDYQPEKRGLDEEQELSSRELVMGVLKNKYIWALSIAYFFIYIVRVGIGDWTALFLIEAKGYSQIGANGVASLFEVGGFFGALLAGWISDKLFEARRGPVNTLFALLLLLCLFVFWSVPKGYQLFESCMLFAIGFATFGPQMLIGVAVSEMAHKKASATANGLAGWVAYIGAATAGFPLGKVIDSLGWNGFFFALVGSAVVAIFLLVPLWGVRRSAPTLAASQT